MSEGTESTATSSESAGGESSSGSFGEKGYEVNASQLSDMGVDLGSDDSSESGDDAFEFSKISATPKQAKAKPRAKASEDPVDELLADEPDEVGDNLKEAAEADVDGEEADEIPDEAAELVDHIVKHREVPLLRHGVKTKVSLEDAVKLAQQGFDYSSNMRAVKLERQAMEKEQAEFVDKLKPQLETYEKIKTEKEQYDGLLEHIQETNTDLYDHIIAAAKEYKRMTYNPANERLFNELKKEISELKKTTTVDESSQLKSDYESQLDEVREMHETKYAKYGVKLDEDAIKNQWIETGKPLEKIYHSLYGKKILAIADSKNKLAMKTKAHGTAPTVGKMRSTKPVISAQRLIKDKSVKYSQIANMLVSGKLR